jgi:hypothetical protein
MFNNNYLPQIQKGTLQAIVVSNRHPSSPRAREPICTRSQYIIYVNSKGKKVAAAHQYLRPDGKLGASGRPDPKEVLSNGVLYILDAKPPRSS